MTMDSPAVLAAATSVHQALDQLSAATQRAKDAHAAVRSALKAEEEAKDRFEAATEALLEAAVAKQIAPNTLEGAAS